MATQFTFANNAVLELHKESYPGKPGWLKSSEKYVGQTALKEDAQTMEIENTAKSDFGNLQLLYADHAEYNEAGELFRGIRHYCAYRNTSLTYDAPWAVCEYWVESYNLTNILEEEDEEYWQEQLWPES